MNNPSLAGKVVVLPVRFNFLHRGHEAYVRSVLAHEPRKVYVFLGRANAFRVPTDPLDDVERRFVLEGFLRKLPAAARERFELLPIFNRTLGEIRWTAQQVADWYGYCEALLTKRGLEPWDVVVSGNTYTQASPGTLQFVDPYRLIADSDQTFVPTGEPVCATYVRSLLYAGDPAWRSYVSCTTADVVEAQLAAFHMEAGPKEGLVHRVHLACQWEGVAITVETVIEDGEFKDHVLARDVVEALRHRGVNARMTPGPLPYVLELSTESNPAATKTISLHSVTASQDGYYLDYRFA